MNAGVMNLLDPVLKKYNVPEWLKPYLYEYARKDPLNAIKRATSFIDVKRKKGVVTSSYIKLPNNITFKTESVVHILSLFFYGEEEAAKISKEWAVGHDMPSRDYAEQFSGMVEMYEKHLRAIKNLLNGMGYKPTEPTSEVRDVFAYMRTIEGWPERMVAANILLKQSYGAAFGSTFYKTFYFVMPEFMRSFGKVFNDTNDIAVRGAELAAAAVKSKAVPDARLVELAEGMLSRVARSIDAEMPMATAAGIRNEAELLRRLAIAYPLHTLKELGVGLDMEKEERAISAMLGKPSASKHAAKRSAHGKG